MTAVTNAALKIISKPRVCFHRPLTRAGGVSYGYSHLVDHVTDAIVHDKNAHVALHCQPVENFRAIPGKLNVLLTMWESRDIPLGDIAHIRQADALIVPSTFCLNVFKRVADCPIYLLPLGVDTEMFPYRRRTKPQSTKEDPFVWLWCASVDPRKGWGLVARAWQLALAGEPGVLLYMKTSGMDRPKYERAGNVIIDQRNLPSEKLAAIFNGAHGFLYPSMGEGFGLTCAEAMSSGCPVVGIEWSGQADFLKSETGWPMRHELQRAKALATRESDAEDGMFEIAVPDPVDMVRQMYAVMRDYGRAREKADRAARLIRTRYTWSRFAAGLGDLLRKLG